MTLLSNVPEFSAEDASLFLAEKFQIADAQCTCLESERDQNFLVQAAHERFVLKISNASESQEFLEAQNSALTHLKTRTKLTPVIIESSDGDHIQSITGNGSCFLTRLVSWLPGQPLANFNFIGPTFLENLGATLGETDNALAGFSHPGFHREFHWDLANAEKVIAERIQHIEDSQLTCQIERYVRRFKTQCASRINQLPKSVIHNDANDANLIVSVCPDDHLFPNKLVGLIDFGDAIYSHTVNNLAIAIAYAILKTDDPLQTAACLATSYHSVHPLNEHEIGCLFGLVTMRLCTSIVIAAEQIRQQPDNPYLLISQQAIQKALPKIQNISLPFAEAYLRNAIGLPVCNNAKSIKSWLRNNQQSFSFPCNPISNGTLPPVEKTLVVDLSVQSDHLPTDVDSITEPVITNIVLREQQSANADVVIGRYQEPRILYTSDHFAAIGDGQENRTMHLGIDIFAAAGTDVVAPMDGTVYYTGAINKPLDYGGLILLTHKTDDGEPFFTLYGHLDSESFPDLKVGQDISNGEKIAELGTANVNGGWTPHLHFQFMIDLLDLEHEFPGVAFASQVETWSRLSPDPNLILGIPETCFPPFTPSKDESMEIRNSRIGGNLSLAYNKPLKIVRGWKQYMFDESGRRYLDAYNNVPHVGHCHPAVIDSVQRQLAKLNTNTRYLHDNINELATRVANTMPDGLDVCYFLNSASEANELALRLARQFTGGKNLLVLESAYHGNSTSLIDISPYKHDGPGGNGPPDWVHTVPLADTYRGLHRDFATAASEYSDAIKLAIDHMDSQLCGFIFESCPSVAGQILFPPEYLTKAFGHVRHSGGLCIADEVQTGYGRLGTHMYGFQKQGVVPDIVILGKPIGNGMPLAAVVTRPTIARAFDNGMEFFSTFGGNPVSCAAGIAVLETLENENLMQNALNVGAVLLQELNGLISEFDLIGDVRGSGFFLGVELVKDQLSRSPAPGEAKFIANIMRDHGVLLGTDGPNHNVIKIRPPMCFDLQNAEQLLQTIRFAFEKV